MEGEIRSIPGDRLVSRILTRARRRPRIGLSPDFYARFGMEDPWAAPPVAGGEEVGGDAFVFLSAQPYYAMLRRLAAARKRREKRLADFTERRAGRKLRAITRAWPGESAASFVTSRIARIAIDDMTLPPVIQPAAPVVQEQDPTAVQPARASGPRGSTTRTARGASAWWSTPFVPARVFGGGHDPEATPAQVAAASPSATRAESTARRAADHAGQRIAASVTRSGAVARALEEALPAAILGAKRSQLARVAAVIEALPVEQQAAEIRRVVRRMGAPAPIVRTVYEDVAAPRPAERAVRRVGDKPTAGLRPVLSRSPAMALAAAADVDRAAAGALATSERADEARGAVARPRRSVATRHAATRASAPAASPSAVPAPLGYARVTAGAPLAASPVAARVAPASAPAAAGPVRRSVVAAPAESGRSPVTAAAVSAALDGAAPVVGAPARAVRLASSARAVSRFLGGSEAPVAPQVAPLAERSESGAFTAPARQAIGARAPRSASFHAASRSDAGRVEGRSLLPRMLPAPPDRVLAAPPQAAPVAPAESAAPARALMSASPVTRVAAALASAPGVHAPARTFRTPSGEFVPSVAVRTPAGDWSGASVVRTPSAAFARSEAVRTPAGEWTGAPVSRTPDGEWTGARVARGAARATPSSRTLPSAALASVPVLASLPSQPASDGVVHAAARADRPAVAGRAATVATRAAEPRTSAAAHAADRGALATSSTLQPRIAPVSLDRTVLLPGRDTPAASAGAVDAPARAAVERAAVERAAARAETTGPTGRRASPARAATVAAAERVAASPLLAASAARALASGAPAAPKPRFSRSGPLSWALPAPAPFADSSAPTEASAAVPADVGTRPGRVARRDRPVRAWAATAADASAPVAAPGGVYMSARAAARVPGVRLLRTEAGRLVAFVVTPGTAPGPAAAGGVPVGAAGATRAPANARLAATTGVAFAQPALAPMAEGEAVLGAPPETERRSASAWAADRARVSEATAYRGAYNVVTPESSARTFTTPEGRFEGATVSRTPARRDRPRRISATAGDMALPTPAPGAPASLDNQGAPAAGPTLRTRRPLEERLHGVSAGQPGAEAPIWAARSSGAPFVRSPGGLFEALAKATTTEEIVRVIYARADGVRETPLAQEAPVVQVIEQIRQEVHREQAASAEATRASRLGAPSATVIQGAYVTPVPSTTRTRRGSGRGLGATARALPSSNGDERIMKLVKKLQGLIHLAEIEGRLADAKRQVRLAEDSPGARAEGQGPVGEGREQGENREKQDIEALGREVLEVVQRELEARRSRRLEDHDESSWW